MMVNMTWRILLEGYGNFLFPLEWGQAVMVDGHDVSEEIRSREVTAAVSAVAAHRGVRKLMVDKQRQLAKSQALSWMAVISALLSYRMQN